MLAIIAAAPGGGKTAFITNYLSKAIVPTVYFSPDSGTATIGPRFISTLSDTRVSDVLSDWDSQEASRRTKHLEVAKRLRHVQWAFDAMLTKEDVRNHLMAYESVHGYYPEMVVLDNLMDLYDEDGDEEGTARFGTSLSWLAELAQSRNIAVVVLHHMTGPYEDANTYPPLSALLGKVGKKPRLALNLFQPAPGELGVVIAKNSNGPPSRGGEYETLEWNMQTQLISG
jgi:replicative DNA helicase